MTTHLNTWQKIFRIFGYGILGLLTASGFALLFGYVVMLLWNWLMPAIFSLSVITFWQSVGLIILARLIFGGFKHGHDHKKNYNPRSFHSKFKSNFYQENKKSHWDKWRFYEKFWKEEGENAFQSYVEKKQSNNENFENK